MIRDIPEPKEWACLIADNAFTHCRVGTVVGRHVYDGVTMFFRVRLLVGNTVRLSPDLVTPLNLGSPADVEIPAIPAHAAVTCDSRRS